MPRVTVDYHVPSDVVVHRHGPSDLPSQQQNRDPSEFDHSRFFRPHYGVFRRGEHFDFHATARALQRFGGSSTPSASSSSAQMTKSYAFGPPAETGRPLEPLPLQPFLFMGGSTSKEEQPEAPDSGDGEDIPSSSDHAAMEAPLSMAGPGSEDNEDQDPMSSAGPTGSGGSGMNSAGMGSGAEMKAQSSSGDNGFPGSGGGGAPGRAAVVGSGAPMSGAGEYKSVPGPASNMDSSGKYPASASDKVQGQMKKRNSLLKSGAAVGSYNTGSMTSTIDPQSGATMSPRGERVRRHHRHHGSSSTRSFDSSSSAVSFAGPGRVGSQGSSDHHLGGAKSAFMYYANRAENAGRFAEPPGKPIPNHPSRENPFGNVAEREQIAGIGGGHHEADALDGQLPVDMRLVQLPRKAKVLQNGIAQVLLTLKTVGMLRASVPRLVHNELVPKGPDRDEAELVLPDGTKVKKDAEEVKAQRDPYSDVFLERLRQETKEALDEEDPVTALMKLKVYADKKERDNKQDGDINVKIALALHGELRNLQKREHAKVMLIVWRLDLATINLLEERFCVLKDLLRAETRYHMRCADEKRELHKFREHNGPNVQNSADIGYKRLFRGGENQTMDGGRRPFSIVAQAFQMANRISSKTELAKKRAELRERSANIYKAFVDVDMKTRQLRVRCMHVLQDTGEGQLKYLSKPEYQRCQTELSAVTKQRKLLLMLIDLVEELRSVRNEYFERERSMPHNPFNELSSGYMDNDGVQEILNPVARAQRDQIMTLGRLLAEQGQVDSHMLDIWNASERERIGGELLKDPVGTILVRPLPAEKAELHEEMKALVKLRKTLEDYELGNLRTGPDVNILIDAVDDKIAAVKKRMLAFADRDQKDGLPNKDIAWQPYGLGPREQPDFSDDASSAEEEKKKEKGGEVIREAEAINDGRFVQEYVPDQRLAKHNLRGELLDGQEDHEKERHELGHRLHLGRKVAPRGVSHQSSSDDSDSGSDDSDDSDSLEDTDSS